MAVCEKRHVVLSKVLEGLVQNMNLAVVTCEVQDSVVCHNIKLSLVFI
jgi:hypothetical protein